MDLIVTNRREVRKEKLTGKDAVGFFFPLRVNGQQEEIKSSTVLGFGLGF